MSRTFEYAFTYEQWKALYAVAKGNEISVKQKKVLELVVPQIECDLERMKKIDELSRKFVVRVYDGMDRVWCDVTGTVSKEEADRVWNERTSNGTRNTSYGDIDYYKIFPADTRMLYDSKRADAGR